MITGSNTGLASESLNISFAAAQHVPIKSPARSEEAKAEVKAETVLIAVVRHLDLRSYECVEKLSMKMSWKVHIKSALMTKIKCSNESLLSRSIKCRSVIGKLGQEAE
jgi:hypothetical protein